MLFVRGIGAEYCEKGCALEGDGDGGIDVRAEIPLRSGRAGDLGGRAGGWKYVSEVGSGRGGKVGEGRPYELDGDMGADTADGVKVAMREVRRE